MKKFIYLCVRKIVIGLLTRVEDKLELEHSIQ